MKYCRVQPLAAHFPAPGHQKTPNVSRACLKNALTFGVSLHNISLFAFMLMHHISAKNLHLLSSRLYCRLWNRTISTSLCIQRGSRTLPPVGNCTLPRRFYILFTSPNITRNRLKSKKFWGFIEISNWLYLLSAVYKFL